MRRTFAIATAALLLVACSASLTGSTSSDAATATPEQVSSTPSPSPSPVASVTEEPSRNPAQPALAGTDLNRVLEVMVGHDLTCERDRIPMGPDPPPDLSGASCTGPMSEGGLDLSVLINYWPDGGITIIEGNSSFSSGIQPADRSTWLRWFAEIPYEGADSAAIEAWLLDNTVEACSQGCYMIFGAARWFHAVGLQNTDQVDIGPQP